MNKFHCRIYDETNVVEMRRCVFKLDWKYLRISFLGKPEVSTMAMTRTQLPFAITTKCDNIVLPKMTNSTHFFALSWSIIFPLYINRTIPIFFYSIAYFWIHIQHVHQKPSTQLSEEEEEEEEYGKMVSFWIWSRDDVGKLLHCAAVGKPRDLSWSIYGILYFSPNVYDTGIFKY